MRPSSVGIIGNGMVGAATAQAWAGHVDDIRVFDRVEEKRHHTLQEAAEAALVFICVPTPSRQPDGGTDTSAIDSVMRDMPTNEDTIYVIKSTVPVGYTQHASSTRKHSWMNLLYSPEFLTQRIAALDAKMPTRNIIGVPVGTSKSAQRLAMMYEDRWPHVPVIIVDSQCAEMAKKCCNAFGAAKVAVFNEFYNWAQQKNVNWNDLLRCMLSGGMISPVHTQVPGPDGSRGFGGACFPKDLASTISEMLEYGIACPTLRGAQAWSRE